MELIDKIADNLYQNIASKFGEVNIADQNASSVLESNQARLFDSIRRQRQMCIRDSCY